MNESGHPWVARLLAVSGSPPLSGERTANWNGLSDLASAKEGYAVDGTTHRVRARSNSPYECSRVSVLQLRLVVDQFHEPRQRRSSWLKDKMLKGQIRNNQEKH